VLAQSQAPIRSVNHPGVDARPAIRWWARRDRSGLDFIGCVDTTSVEIVALRRSCGLVFEALSPLSLELDRRDMADGFEQPARPRYSSLTITRRFFPSAP